MKIPAEYGLCGSSWCDAACLAILISCYSSPWIPHSKQINNSRFSCPRSSTCGLHPLLLFLPRTRLSSLYLLSFLLLCCQLIPTGTLSLKFRLTSSGRLSVILWERSGASGYPVAALSTRKSHLHFQLSSFPSRSIISPSPALEACGRTKWVYLCQALRIAPILILTISFICWLYR